MLGLEMSELFVVRHHCYERSLGSWKAHSYKLFDHLFQLSEGDHPWDI